MRIVITGASSFIGMELTDFLLAQGHHIIAVCRPESKSSLPNGIEVVTLKMNEYRNLHRFITHADIFVNLAWAGTNHGGRNLGNVQKTNISSTIIAMIEAKKMGCKVFVESGSQAEYGTILGDISENTPCSPFSEYGKAKLEVKNRLFEFSERLGIKYIHLRIFSLYGENDHPWTLVMTCVDKMLRNEPIALTSCTQNWNFLYVKDAVKQISSLWEYAITDQNFQHEVFNIASKDTRVLKDFIEEIHRLTRSSSSLNYGAIMPSNIVSLKPDTSKTESAIGFISEFTFEDVVNRIIKKYKS